MRLWAWSHGVGVQANGQVETQETYPCYDYCLGKHGESDNVKQRKRWRCALPGFPRRAWLPPFDSGNPHETAAPPTRYMGRLRILRDDPEKPRESHDEGCPGAWYRSAFVFSLHKYERLLSSAGLSENMMLARCEDRLVVEAIQYYEREKLASGAHDEETINRRGAK